MEEVDWLLGRMILVEVCTHAVHTRLHRASVLRHGSLGKKRVQSTPAHFVKVVRDCAENGHGTLPISQPAGGTIDGVHLLPRSFSGVLGPLRHLVRAGIELIGKCWIVDMQLVGCDSHDWTLIIDQCRVWTLVERCKSRAVKIPYFSCILAISNMYRPRRRTS